jgi:hypothetical protein
MFANHHPTYLETYGPSCSLWARRQVSRTLQRRHAPAAGAAQCALSAGIPTWSPADERAHTSAWAAITSHHVLTTITWPGRLSGSTKTPPVPGLNRDPKPETYRDGADVPGPCQFPRDHGAWYSAPCTPESVRAPEHPPHPALPGYAEFIEDLAQHPKSTTACSLAALLPTVAERYA